MSGWSIYVPASEVIWTGVVQGIGAGAIIVPLGVVTFATLDPVHRTEAASIWNLVRSAGSSIGIAVAIFIVARMASVSRAELVNFVSPFNLAFQNPKLAGWASLEHTENLARFSEEITRQALMVGYIDVFYLSAWAAILALPLIVLLTRAK